MNAAALGNFDASIQKDIDDGNIFGASVILGRGGKVLHKKVFGTVAPGRKAAEDDLYLMMSLSKSFTAALVLRAIDQGRFTLDTRVAEILPAFAAGGKQRVTVRMLLTHTGGTYPSLAPPPGLTLADIGNLEKLVNAIAAVPAAFTPGTRSFYNSFGGICVLGQMLVLTDPQQRSFSKIAREDLFKPLGMQDMAFGLDHNNPRRVPVSFTPKNTTPMSPTVIQMLSVPFGEGMEVPAGNAFGTAMDVFRFADTLRAGGNNGTVRLISPALLDYAARNHTGDMINGAWENATEAANAPAYRANFSLLGGYARDEGHFLTPMGFTASPRAFCAVGGGSTMWMVDPARDLTFVFLSAGFIEGLSHSQRLSRLSDLALAACD
jgi:CubicO group peptidase (beta-lactamase class C family)